MTRKRKSKVEMVAEKPAPTARMAEAIASARANHAARPVRPNMNCEYEGNALHLEPAHNDPEGAFAFVKDTFGTASGTYSTALILQVVRALGTNEAAQDQTMLNSALAFVGAVSPENEVESALAMQMWTTHSLAMEMAGRIRGSRHVPELQAYGNLTTKLQRTFTAQLEALSKLRRGGEQVVRHIHVDNRGGQAVIAETINTGGAGNGKVQDQSYEPFPALPCQDAAGYGVPVTGDAGQEAVPHTWGSKPRRTQGQ